MPLSRCGNRYVLCDVLSNAVIRKYEPGDEIAIGHAYFDAVHQIASKDYSLVQCNAWAGPIEDDPNWAENWRKRCERKQPWVAIVEGELAGFIELDPDGHIDCTYAAAAFAGKGYMSAIMERIFLEAHELGLPKLFAEVSITARPFFERHGFEVVRENWPEIRGVRLLNYIMERRLD